jgi:hypothetical protein
VTDLRVTEQYVETVVRVVPHVRVTDQYVESVVRSIPHVRVTDQYAETIRVKETHVVRVSVDIIIGTIARTSAATSRTRTIVLANAIVELASVTAISPASAMTTRHQSVVIAIAQTYSSTATPVNATATTTRSRTIAGATLHGAQLGDNLVDAIDATPGQIMVFPFASFTREPGEVGYSFGNTGWFRTTAVSTGIVSIYFDVGYYPYLAFFESSVPHATSFSQLTEISRGGWYATGSTAPFSVVTGHTYYWQVDDNFPQNNTVQLHMLPPPVRADTSSTVARAQAIVNTLVNAGLFTNYVNVGTPVPYDPTTAFRGGTAAGTLSLDAGIGTSTLGGSSTTQDRSASGVVTVDAPVIDVPGDVDAVPVVTTSPAVTVINAGTGSLPGGDWEFYVAYYVGDPVDGRFTQASAATAATLPVYDAPAGPTPPAGPVVDEGPPPTTLTLEGTWIEKATIATDLSVGIDFIVTYNTAVGDYDDPFIDDSIDGPALWWYAFTLLDATVTFTPIVPANGRCIWAIYIDDSDADEGMSLSHSYDSSDPNLTADDIFVAAGTNIYIMSYFIDDNTVSPDGVTGNGSFGISSTSGGEPA